MILLDTHTLIWWTSGSSRIGPKTSRFLQAAPFGQIAVSAVSFLEIGYLIGRRRFSAVTSLVDLRQEFLTEGGIEISLDGDIALRAAQIAGLADPFDRAILATADEGSFTLVTADTAILDWPGKVERRDAQQ